MFTAVFLVLSLKLGQILIDKIYVSLLGSFCPNLLLNSTETNNSRWHHSARQMLSLDWLRCASHPKNHLAEVILSLLHHLFPFLFCCLSKTQVYIQIICPVILIVQFFLLLILPKISFLSDYFKVIGKILQTVRVSNKSVLLIWLKDLVELLFHLSDASEEFDKVSPENLSIHRLILELLSYFRLQ